MKEESNAVLRRAAPAETSSSQEVGELAAEATARVGVAERAVGRERGGGLLTIHHHPAPPSSPEEKAEEEKHEEEDKKELRAALHASEAARKEAEARAMQAEAAREAVEAKVDARAAEEGVMVERAVERLVREGLVDKAVASALAEKMDAVRAEAVGVKRGGSGPATTVKSEAATQRLTEGVVREGGLLVRVSLPPGLPPTMPPLRRLSLSGGAAACAPSASPDATQHG